MNYRQKILLCLPLLSLLLTGFSFAETTMPETGVKQAMTQTNGDEPPAASAPEARDKSRVTPGHLGNMTYQLPPMQNAAKTVIFPIKGIEYNNKGWYFSQTVYFGDTFKHPAYIGMRPTDGKNMAAFSTFGKGTKNLMPSHCHSGADGGAGLSCTKFTELEKGKTYYFTFTLDENDKDAKKMNVWKGYVSTSPKGYGTIIGKWATPKDWGYIQNITGFFEFYLKAPSCQDIPKGIAEFGVPMSNGQPWMLRDAFVPDSPGECHGKKGIAKALITKKDGVVRFETM